MIGGGSYATHQVVGQAIIAHGYTTVDDLVPVHVDRLLFTFARGTLDAASLVAHGRKTLQPEDFAALSRLHSMFSSPVIPRSRTHNSKSRSKDRSSLARLTGGTTLPGAYFNALDAIDSAAYTTTASPGSGGSTGIGLDVDEARSALPYSSHVGGGSRWALPSDAVARLLREYRTRTNNDIRVTDSAKLYLRSAIQSNLDAVLDSARAASPKSTKLTTSALQRAADGHILVLP